MLMLPFVWSNKMNIAQRDGWWLLRIDECGFIRRTINREWSLLWVDGDGALSESVFFIFTPKTETLIHEHTAQQTQKINLN